MSEILVVSFLLLLAASLAAVAVRRQPLSRRAVARTLPLAAGVACALLLAAAFANREPRTPPAAPDLPLQVRDDGYTSSDRCRSCHPRQYETWHASYHRTMTQTVTPESVVGDFDDVELRFAGQHYRLFRHDDRFFGEMQPLAAAGARRPPARVVVPLKQMTGSHHTQLYWYPSGQGRALKAFPLVYLRSEARWVPRSAAFVTPPGIDPRVGSQWNRVCIECHTTHPRPRIRPAMGADSHVTELGIACEACHGPGRDHVDANRAPMRRYRMHFSSEPDPTIVDPSDLSHVRASQVCGQCHVVKTLLGPEHIADWMENGPRFRPGDDLEETVNVVSNASLSRPTIQTLLSQYPDFLRSTFWDDGIVRVAGREYSALIESPCFQRGELSCLSCHTLHKSREDPRELAEWANDQLAPEMGTNQACIQCHERFEDESLAASHSNHPARSSGSECQNCHMPHTTYGLLKAIRGHEISSPRVVLGPTHGRPNACNLCHLDRSLGWTAQTLGAWYGQEIPELSEDDRSIAAGVRWALEGDAGLRALVAWSMGWPPAQEASSTDWLVPYLAELMGDPYDAVRIIASRSLKTIAGFETAAFDDLAAPQRRARAVAAILARWGDGASSNGGRTPGTLFDSQGRLDSSEVRRLLENRDDRPLSLAE